MYDYISYKYMFIYNISQCVLCQQIIANTTFENTQTKVKFDTYQKAFCKCTYDCELLECPFCKIQYVRKSKTEQNGHLKKCMTT